MNLVKNLIAMNEPTEFEILVLKMRNAQKKYFKTRNQEALHAAKILEQKVDNYLASQNIKLDPVVENQKSLF